MLLAVWLAAMSVSWLPAELLAAWLAADLAGPRALVSGALSLASPYLSLSLVLA